MTNEQQFNEAWNMKTKIIKDGNSDWRTGARAISSETTTPNLAVKHDMTPDYEREAKRYREMLSKGEGVCPKCGKRLRYYDGALGYEAMRCESCDYELDLNAEANAKATQERLKGERAHKPVLEIVSVGNTHKLRLRDTGITVEVDGQPFSLRDQIAAQLAAAPETAAERDKLREQVRELVAACKKLAPILGHLSVSAGRIFPIDDYRRERRLIPKEANDFIDGSLAILAAIKHAEEGK